MTCVAGVASSIQGGELPPIIFRNVKDWDHILQMRILPSRTFVEVGPKIAETSSKVLAVNEKHFKYHRTGSKAYETMFHGNVDNGFQARAYNFVKS